MLDQGMRQIRIGDPLDEATEFCPVSNVRLFAHVTAMIEGAAQDRATRLGAPISGVDPLIVPPTILTGLSPQSAAAQTEIFGPVVTALGFADEGEAIAIANATDFGLAGAVWTGDGARAHRVAAAVRAGTFWINSYKAIHVSSPFGGSRSSGFGRSSGHDALMEYTASKSIWLDPASVPRVAFGYAPST